MTPEQAQALQAARERKDAQRRAIEAAQARATERRQALYAEMQARGMDAPVDASQLRDANGAAANAEMWQALPDQRQNGPVGSAAVGAGQGLYLGWGDELNALSGALLGSDPEGRKLFDYRRSFADRRASNLDRERARINQAREDNPGAYAAGEIGGAFIAPGGAVAAGGRGLGARMIAGGLTGGATGATYGAGVSEGDASDRLQGAKMPGAVGLGLGAAGPLVGAGAQRIANSLRRSGAARQVARNAPSTDDLRSLGNQLYQQVDEAGVRVRPEAFDDFMQGAQGEMVRSGLDTLPGPGSLTPKAARVAQIGGDMADQAQQRGSVPFREIDQLRRQAGNAAADMASGRPTPDAQLGMRFRGSLDDFVSGLDAEDVTAGDVQQLQGVLDKARDVWGRMSRSQTIDDAIEASEEYVSGPASGLRNQFSRILKNPQMRRQFSEAERALMRKVVNGGVVQNTLNLIGGGLGQLGAIGVGANAGGATGAIAGFALSKGARQLGEALTARQADMVRRVVAGGGVPNSLPQVVTDRGRTLIDALMERAARSGAMQVERP